MPRSERSVRGTRGTRRTRRTRGRRGRGGLAHPHHGHAGPRGRRGQGALARRARLASGHHHQGDGAHGDAPGHERGRDQPAAAGVLAAVAGVPRVLRVLGASEPGGVGRGRPRVRRTVGRHGRLRSCRVKRVALVADRFFGNVVAPAVAAPAVDGRLAPGGRGDADRWSYLVVVDRLRQRKGKRVGVGGAIWPGRPWRFIPLVLWAAVVPVAHAVPHVMARYWFFPGPPPT